MIGDIIEIARARHSLRDIVPEPEPLRRQAEARDKARSDEERARMLLAESADHLTR